MPQIRRARRISASRRAAEEVPRVRQQRRLHVLKHIPLSNNLASGAVVKRVPGVGVEVVVDRVDEAVSACLGGAAGGVVDVVSLQSDHVV